MASSARFWARALPRFYEERMTALRRLDEWQTSQMRYWHQFLQGMPEFPSENPKILLKKVTGWGRAPFPSSLLDVTLTGRLPV